MSTHTTMVGMERKLAAIFSADVAGYSRLMGDDEEAMIRTFTAYRALISTLIQQYRGRVVDAPGDNLLAEFASVVGAVRCGVEIQEQLKTKNADLPDSRKMQFRIGINLGDVVVEGERLYGDGVNIAARLESLAIPGGICISGTVYDHVENKLALHYEYQGEQTVKNIAKPVRVYRVMPEESSSHQVASPPSSVQGSTFKIQRERRAGLARRNWALVTVSSLLLIAATLVAVHYLPFSLLGTRHSELSTEEAQPPSLPLPDKPSIIVLPFVNMSQDPEQEYFSDGITEDITADLSKISSLFVIARNSAFTYKGKAVKVQDVSREMGVRYVLEGSVRRADKQVRITVQLIDATTGGHLWSDRYDRPLQDIFALQDEIVQKIVTTLKLQLTLSEQGVLVRKHTDNLEAYDTFLRGVEYFWRFTQEANAQARRLYEKAIALDSRYAVAYAALGATYYIAWIWRWNPDPQMLERALEMEQRAIALDDSLPAAHGFLGMVYIQKKQYEQAIAESDRAIALDPNDAESRTTRAEILNFAGRPKEALQSVEQAMRLNPRYPAWYLFEVGWAYNWMGQYAEAIAAFKTLLLQNPNFLSAYPWLAVSYVQQWTSQLNPDSQTLKAGLEAVQRTIALHDSYWLAHLVLGYIYLYQQQYDQALTEMERAVALAPNDAWGRAGLAQVLSSVGRWEDALKAAAQASRLKPGAADIHLSSIGTAYATAEHYEEARTPLQRFLSRYPNWLPFRLMLAAVYSELGQAAEARAEAAEVLRLNPNFSLEVHKQRMPIKDPATLERHIAALRKAGLK